MTRGGALFEALERETAQDARSASGLPFQAYSDADVFEREVERVFQSDWLSLCPAANLAEPGDYFAIQVAGEPIVVIRGKDNELRALSNVCRHRGTLLLDEGFGNADRFLCPYHAWSYDHTGALRSVPYPGDIEIVKEDHHLPHYRLEVWNGVIFVCLDSDVPPVAEKLASLDAAIAHYDLGRYVNASPQGALRTWRTNWKLALENGMESYHLFKVHKETLETVTPTRNAFYMTGSAPWTLTGGTYLEPSPRYGDEPSGIGDFELGNYVLVSIPPTLVGILTPTSWGWISVLPTAPDECQITGGSLHPHPASQRGTSQSGGLYESFMEEDRVICERNQLAMRTRRGRPGRMIQLERVLVDFHQYLGSRLFDVATTPRFTAPECPAAFRAS